jgi:membrane protease YdiL (CAAX protease family)
MRWYALVFLVPLALNGTAILVSLIFGDGPQGSEVLNMFMENPIAIVPYTIFLFIVGPLPEELGWRGYLLDRLQERWNALTANFILGVLWLVWMLPLFFINGLYQHDELGFGTLGFWMFCIFIIAISVVYAWVYNSTNRGLLAVVLLHLMFNFVGSILPLSPLADIVRTVLVVTLAVVIVFFSSSKTLASNLSI